MTDQWNNIFGKEYQAIQHPVDSYAEPQRTSTAHRIVAPECEKHCSGIHRIDGVMRCPQCHTIGYEVTLHEYNHMDGHYFTTLEGVNGLLEYKGLGTPKCPNCNVEFERE